MLEDNAVVAEIGEADAPSTTAGARTPIFALQGQDGTLAAIGEHCPLEAGPLATLGQRVAAFFARKHCPGGAPALLVGAVAFDPLADHRLYQPIRLLNPQALRSAAPLPLSSSSSVGAWSVSAEPESPHFAAAVRKALDAINAEQGSASALRKVVLARSLVLKAGRRIDPMALFDRLGGDPGITRFVASLPPIGGEPRFLVGATPEPLVSKRGASITSFPLAGSMPRAVEGADRALMASDKDRREHALVVEANADLLAPHCATLSVPSAPELRATRTMWHLGSQIEGVLARPEELSSAALAALLHPTPAVGGTPREKALGVIRAIEPVARGFYAGAVGWTDARGDGDWHVSLRCAEIAGAQARIHAGAGIVAGSDPEAEVAETSAKFRAMLDASGIDERGTALTSTHKASTGVS